MNLKVFDEPKLFGPYRLFAKVAEGGMAEVFLALSTKREFENQFIAIKKLHRHLNANKAFVNLLIHEAKIGVLLSHPSIAEVYDLGSFKTEFFLAMEYVHGKSLDRIIDRIRAGKAEPMSLEVAAYIFFEVLRALGFAHSLKDVKERELNIIHRDVSPGNILLEYKGNVKLADFGIATAESRLQVEFSNHAMGKMVYMSPEQAVNDPVTPSSDLYSLGVLFFEMLTGRLPFESDTPSGLHREIIAGDRMDARRANQRLSKELARLIDVALQRAAKKRYQSAPEMFDVFHRYFLKSEELDFDSRTVRAYCRKKLAEYLRNNFEDEIVEELELIQEALDTPLDEDLKKTAPQNIPANINERFEPADIPESTQFVADHTNEATRHYPLTEKERQSIIEGLPPRQVLEAQNVGGSEFEMATIPDYDLQFNANRSIGDKLDLLSVGRDEKEQLRTQQPALEISSQEALEAFEQSTFSGRRKKSAQVDYDLTLTDGQDLDGFDDLKTRASVGAITQPEPRPEFVKQEALQQFDRTSEVPAELLPPSTEELQPTVTSEVKRKIRLQPFRAVRNFFRRPVVVGSLLGLAISGLIAGAFISANVREWTSKQAKVLERSWDKRMNPRAFLPTQYVSIVFLGEAGLDKQKELFQHWNEQESTVGFQALEKFFNTEFRKYSGSKDSALRLFPIEPRAVSSALSSLPNLTDLLSGDGVFAYFQSLGISPQSASDSTLFVYILPEQLESSAFPSFYSGIRPPGTGVVFLKAQDADQFEAMLQISIEIAYMYGAERKIDEKTRLPAIPSGLGNPDKKPLFPQTRAELLGEKIMLDPIRVQVVKNFDELTIGPQTAFELGWINRVRRDEIADSSNEN